MAEHVAVIGDDLIWGAEAISKEIGRNKRMTYWALETGKLPATKIGSQWVTSRRKLREVFGLDVA